jgi:hypothetical protein
VLVLPSGIFDSFADAVWWAFLRLSDPGYLGDDRGVLLRTVSTFLTVAGYVVFLGSLVAIMTQWLNATVTRLEAGLTPVKRRGHVLIVGWTNRTVPIVADLLGSETRLRHFLRRHRTRQLHVVILDEVINPSRRQDLRDQLGDLWQAGRVTLRSGSSLQLQHLERADFLNAAAIIVPAGDFEDGEPGVVDTRTIKTLLSIAGAAEEEGVANVPLVVAEVFDQRKVAVARRAYRGPLELVASDVTVARLIVQTMRHRGLSAVYNEILTQGEGNEIYLIGCEGLVGLPAEALSQVFPRGVVLGLVRPSGDGLQPLLNPEPGVTVAQGDRVAVLVRSFDDAGPQARREPNGHVRADRLKRGAPGTLVPLKGTRRILLLGWGRKVPAILRELLTYEGEKFEVDLLSTMPAARREATLVRYGLGPDDLGNVITLRQVEGDYSIPSELYALEPWRYDNVVMLGSELRGSGQEADARTILGALLLEEIAEEREDCPAVLLELLEPANESLVAHATSEVVVSPLVTSHMLSQIALRRELRVVLDALFTAGGTEIVFRRAVDYGLESSVTFEQMQAAASAHGETALGVRVFEADALERGRKPSAGGPHPTATGTLTLNPDRGRTWAVSDGFEVVVIATYRE